MESHLSKRPGSAERASSHHNSTTSHAAPHSRARSTNLEIIMHAWEEQIVKLKTSSENADTRSKQDQTLADHLVRSLYFSSQAAQKLRGAVDSAANRETSDSIKSVLVDVLHSQQALIDGAVGFDLAVTDAIVQAQQLIHTELATLSKH